MATAKDAKAFGLEGVLLHLTYDEAIALRAYTGAVSGPAGCPAKDLTTGIFHTLEVVAGPPWWQTPILSAGSTASVSKDWTPENAYK